MRNKSIDRDVGHMTNTSGTGVQEIMIMESPTYQLVLLIIDI